jgi:hypothetical protein
MHECMSSEMMDHMVDCHGLLCLVIVCIPVSVCGLLAVVRWGAVRLV